MERHLYGRKNECRPVLNIDLVLTDEIKAAVMMNRTYVVNKRGRPPKQLVVTKPSAVTPSVVTNNITNNITVTQNIHNNIDLGGIDCIKKLTAFLQFHNQKLNDFEKTVEIKHDRVAGPHEAHDDGLATENILKIVADVCSANGRMENFNVVCDKKDKQISMFDDGRWQTMSLEDGTLKILEHVRDYYLAPQERHLLRKIKLRNSEDSRDIMNKLKEYFYFIASFDMDPSFNEKDDDDILFDPDTEEYDAIDHTKHVNKYSICDEFMPKYWSAKNNLTGTDKRKHELYMHNSINDATSKNKACLDTKLQSLVESDNHFKDRLLEVR